MRNKQQKRGWLIGLVVLLLAGLVAWWFTSMKPKEKNKQEVKSQNAKEKKDDEQQGQDETDENIGLKNGDWKEFLKNSKPSYQNVYGPNRNKPESKIRWVELVFLTKENQRVKPYFIQSAKLGPKPNIRPEKIECGAWRFDVGPREKKREFRFRAVLGCDYEEYEWGYDQKWHVQRISEDSFDSEVYGKTFHLPEKKEVDPGEVHYIPILISEEDFMSPEERKRKKQEKHKKEDRTFLQIKNVPYWIKGKRWDWDRQIKIEYYHNQKNWSSREPQKYEKKDGSLFVPIEWRLLGKDRGEPIQPGGSLVVKVVDRRRAEEYILFYRKNISDQVVDVKGPADIQWKPDKIVERTLNLRRFGLNRAEDEIKEISLAIPDKEVGATYQNPSSVIEVYNRHLIHGDSYPKEMREAIEERYKKMSPESFLLKAPPGKYQLWLRTWDREENDILLKENFKWPPE